MKQAYSMWKLISSSRNLSSDCLFVTTRTRQAFRSDLICLLIVALVYHVIVLKCSAGSLAFPPT